jgi:hypothetical protein
MHHGLKLCDGHGIHGGIGELLENYGTLPNGTVTRHIG